MTGFFGILAGCCVIYGTIVVLYSGISNLWLWAGLAAFFGGLAWGYHYYSLHKKAVPLWVPVSAGTFCVACLVIFIAIEALIFLGASGSSQPNLDYVIVLGARVKEEGVSNSLKKRLDTAIQYSRENPETVFVLSGGKGDDEPVTEAEAMRDYMVYNGISPDKILLETHSTSTVENIAYSRILIDTLRKKNQEEHHQDERALPAYLPAAMGQRASNPHQIGILTSNFHLYRAMQIAKKQGMQEISGIAAASDRILFVHFCFRDGLAILKERLAGNL